jgi:predicted PhzF superfamily epimerase YddE/YHI9
MPDSGEAQVIRCMFGTNAGTTAEGGLATVYWLSDVAAEQTIVSAEAMLARQRTRAFASVFVAGDAEGYVAESFTPQGARIQFCWHGALAAAWAVFNEHAPDAGILEFKNARHRWYARRSDAADRDIALIYKSPVPVDCEVPDFASTCLGSQPVAAAELGDESDYLVLELTDPESVRQVQPDFTAISAATRRALIVTAKAAHNEEPGCVFRYFAPQYGDPEDAATGSAAVQLAAYWPQRLQAERFAAVQLSRQGAVMQLQHLGDTVELAARVGYR